MASTVDGVAFLLLAFAAIGGGGHQKRRQAAVHTHPAATLVRTARVLVVGVQVGGLDVQRDPPPATVVANGGEQDFRPAFCQHAS